MFDICIVGSGPSAVISAHVFLQKGYKVCLLDGGIQSKYDIPSQHFCSQLNESADFFYPPQHATRRSKTGDAQITRAREHLNQ